MPLSRDPASLLTATTERGLWPVLEFDRNLEAELPKLVG